MRRLLRSSVRGRGREVGILVAWSLVEALPAFLSGLLVARAIDKGFLAGDPTTGFAWLGLLAASVLLGGWATRQTFLRLGAIVEPFRDELIARTVHGALRRSTEVGAVADGAGVARLTQQVEIVREAYASVLLVVQGFLVTAVGAIVGLATLEPIVLVFVVPPLVAGLALFGYALPGMARRQRLSILADEAIAESASVVAGAMRDVAASGAEEQVRASVGAHIDEQARATRELARFTAVRTIAVAVGGLLPIVLILAAGSWLLDRGASVGTILGALTYVAQGVHPALQTLVRGLGNTGLWLFVTLARIVEETEAPDSDARARRRAAHVAPEYAVIPPWHGRSPPPPCGTDRSFGAAGRRQRRRGHGGGRGHHRGGLSPHERDWWRRLLADRRTGEAPYRDRRLWSGGIGRNTGPLPRPGISGHSEPGTPCGQHGGRHGFRLGSGARRGARLERPQAAAVAAAGGRRPLRP
jgi:ATP-binding cassette subfamily C protein